MANHVRRQIRDAIKTALTGLATTGANVFKARAYELDVTQLPALCIESGDEGNEYPSMGLPRRAQRTYHVQVTAVARAGTGVDDVLDQICLEAEKVLAMPCAQLAGIVQTISLLGTQPDISGKGDKPIGQAAMLYEVVYSTAENAPDVAQ
jgi:hypothetical protein